MPYHADYYAEMQRRKIKAADRLVPCMNDTKWREVFACMARHGLKFGIAWVRNDAWDNQNLHRVPESWIGTHGIRDPGIGGPCDYWEILWIRVPVAVPNDYLGKVPKRQPIEPFLAELASLGSLPLKQTEKYVEVRGYES